MDQVTTFHLTTSSPNGRPFGKDPSNSCKDHPIGIEEIADIFDSPRKTTDLGPRVSLSDVEKIQEGRRLWEIEKVTVCLFPWPDENFQDAGRLQDTGSVLPVTTP
jgi:hypothetical protein